MSGQTHGQTANFIWSICNLLRGPYKRNEYRKVILPLTILRRFDCILEPTKDNVLAEFDKLKGKSENIVSAQLRTITGVPFYNLSKLTFRKLLDDPNQIAPNLNSYINSFSPNVRQIFEKLDFGIQVNRMNEKHLLFNVVKEFASDKIDLSPSKIDNLQMGYVFEELIRIGAEQANEEAGEHFTPREVIKLMVNLLLSPETDLRKSHVVKTIYDPACGTGGMLSVSEDYIRKLNSDAQPHLFGQDWNDEAYGICRADMLIKGEDSDNIKPDCTFEKDGFPREKFDYMLANPPFGVEWKQQQKTIENEKNTLGYDGRFGAGTPRINDGSLLFLQHMISKMRRPEEGGSRIGIVFNGSPLFTGDAGSGESNIRQWIMENDWLEAIVALPELKVVLDALSEKDGTAEICLDAKGNPEADSDLRDTENVPLKENIDDYFKREVLPHVPDAWIDHAKTKVGYEIPLNRHFYRYEPPRALEEIAADVKALESEIVAMLAEITGSAEGLR